MKMPQPKLPMPPAAVQARADAFVAGTEREPVKRLTIDLTPEQHAAFKSMAALEGKSMVDLVRGWIDAFVDTRQRSENP